MRLYLSSYRLGNHSAVLTKLLRDGTRVAVIANAQDAYTEGRAERLERETSSLIELGLKPALLDLREYRGKPAQLKTALAQFDGLWVLGGNSFILRRAFQSSGLDDILPDLLKQDRLVYAGYSAGIDQLVPHLHGVELVDDPHEVPEGYDRKIIWKALGIVPYAIAPHYQSNHPESADIDQSVEYLINHHIPFIALRDGQVIVRDGDHEEVLT